MLFQPLVCPAVPPDSARASTDLLLITSHLSSSETRRNNLLPSWELLQVRKPLPNTLRSLWGFISLGLAQPAQTLCCGTQLPVLGSGAQGPWAALSLCSAWQQPHG